MLELAWQPQGKMKRSKKPRDLNLMAKAIVDEATALASPPLRPPSLPSATAAGFLPSSSGSPTPADWSTMAFAKALGSEGFLVAQREGE